jgi:hypothetical protein
MWDSTHQDRAKAEGWRLVTTINNGDGHPLWDVATHGPRFKDDRTASLAVIDAAKRGGTLHQHALKLVADSRLRPTKGKKK